MYKQLRHHAHRVLDPAYWKRGPAYVLRMVRPRRFHAFCIGAARTGTHSVARLLQRNFRSQHEPDVRQVVQHVLAMDKGERNDDAVQQFVLAHDRAWRLEMNASHLLGYFVEPLVHLFPDALFVITFRSPASWLDSAIDRYINALAGRHEHWQHMRQVMFGTEMSHAPEEQVLAAHGVPGLDDLLRYYAQHNARVLAAVPPERLLILRTEALSTSHGKLAAFLGIDVQQLDVTNSHRSRAPQKHRLVGQLDPGYVADRIEAVCGDVLGGIEERIGSPVAQQD